MGDITAILIDYSNQTLLYKAINSLKILQSRLRSIIVLLEHDIGVNDKYDLINCMQFIPVKDKKFEKAINNVIKQTESTYILLLQDTSFISPTLEIDSLSLPQDKEVIETIQHNIRQPVLIRTSFFKRQQLLPTPFQEALLPAWVNDIDGSYRFLKEDILRQSRKNNSKSQLEKQKFIQKYQLESMETNHPSLTVLISNYNMERYVEDAIVSCLLQNTQPDQILIIDDGSTDSSYNKIQRWSSGKNINIFQQNNTGKAEAINHVLPHVTSEFILELDADDWLDPDAVFTIKKYLSNLPKEASLLYGNLRKWKQLENNDLLYKKNTKGNVVQGRHDLLKYRFPLGPRIYRSSTLKQIGGFPVIEFENGRLYEDVSVLNKLITNSQFVYKDFTVYNVREHKESITKNNLTKWKHFIKNLKET